MTIHVVLDTNTVISAMFWKGAPYRVFHADDTHDIRFHASPFMLRELAETLKKPKFDAIVRATSLSRIAAMTHYRNKVHVVEPASVPNVIPDDPPDNHVLACAVKAQAGVIMSGDGHLKALKEYAGIPIRNAADFLKEFLSSGN